MRHHPNSAFYSRMFSRIKKSISGVVAFEPCSNGGIGLTHQWMAEEVLQVEMSTVATGGRLAPC